MSHAKSLILSELALFNVAVTSVSDQEERHHRDAAGQQSSIPRRRYSSFNLNSTSDDNDPIVEVAKAFLVATCPDLLTILDAHYDQASARDRFIKIGRSVNATLRYAQEATEQTEREDTERNLEIWSPDEEETILGSDEVDRTFRTNAILNRLVQECHDLATLLSSPVKIPTVRYGRTNLQMPIVTLGCMRFQQSWNRGGPNNITSPSQLDEECQANLVNILRHAIHCGVNHIETAKGYGCSEMQIGLALKVLFAEGVCKREDLIIQTKGGISSSTTKAEYKSSILEQIATLGVEYVDLFSVHGVNTADHVEWLFNHGEERGNLIDAVRELKAEGKIRWIGFSTHAPAHIIKTVIESDAFDYMNVHYQFLGSYTASGDGDGEDEGNLANIRLAHKHDMGVFIISPYDKGGKVYAPSHLCRELMLPEMEPMEYGSFWLWYHEKHCQGGEPAPIHTIVCGAARPSDLDQPVIAALRSITNEAVEDFDAVSRRIQVRKDRILGRDWANNWHVGLPNYFQSEKRGFQIGNMVWLYNTIQIFGMLDFAKDRYGTLVNNSEKWDVNKTWRENVFASPVFAWMPGCGYDPSHDYTADLMDVPEENKARVLAAMRFVHEWCCPKKQSVADDEKKDGDEIIMSRNVIPLEWQTAYDMRPWTAFPERD